ncbi:MAG: GNAT family N-acetyltransferase [Defluviitaleaceae bacterium]|nr:GNAT family N-acetyltransferase [Defluviitaleaceae bacterium]
MNEISGISIETGIIEDVDTAAELTFMAYHKFSYDIFGKVGEETAISYYKKLWLHGSNRFGYKFSYVAKMDGKPIALMTCYPSYAIKNLVAPTVRQLFIIGKFSFFCHFITHLSNFYYFSGSQDVYNDEFYIATLSVLPQYRSKGVGAMLLNHARKITQDYNLRRCVLHVSADNTDGIRFYERNGFHKANPNESPSTYFRMVCSVNVYT